MFNYGTAPYGNRPPPGYSGGFTGQGGAPGTGAPPGMAAPGTGPPPGMEQPNTQQAQRPGGFPPNFQPPQNMPNINFSAPVIRLGTTGPGPRTPLGGDPGRRESERSGRMGLGASDQRQPQQMALVPPTKDEVMRTIFVGGITEGAGGDEGLERILRCAGHLRRWTRAMDADDKPCRFGFAEYEDPDSLATAVDVLKDVQVPVKAQSPDKDETAKAEEVEKSSLLIVFDEGTLDYIEQAQAARGDEDPIQKQARLDAAKGALASVLADLTNPSAPVQQSDMSKVDNDGDTNMATEGNGDAEVVTIPLTADDELSDIPAEMRETVAKEIAAFRDRSNRRDLERLRREEEAEAMDRRQGFGRPRSNRLASPPATQASGGANGLPTGPREKQMPSAPAGPKGHGSTAKAVSFVNGTGLHGAGGGWIDREDEDSEASDDELERRRQAKRDEEQEKRYLDQERKWLNRERSRTAALEREKNRDKDEASKVASTKDAAAKALADLDEDVEAKRGADDYHLDRSQWIRNRAQFRAREANLDDMDRTSEERERARDQQQQQQAMGMADDFLNRQAVELDQKAAASNEAPREPQRFKLSLGAAAQQKAQQAASSNKRTVAEVEGLLEDEEEENATTKRTLVPIKFDSAAEAAGLTEEERQQAVRQLAAEIPTDKEGLWAWQVKWDHVDEAVLSEQLRPFVEKKIVEYLGVQEQMLVEAVEEHVRKRGGPGDLVELLEGPLDEEAEILVKKLWRMIIFFSESEKRGLSA